MAATNRLGEVEAVIRTSRLVLTPLDPRHATPLFELLNDWEVVRMLSEVPWPLRFEDVDAFLRSEHAATEDFVILGGDGPIGVCAVKRSGSGEPPRTMPRLGYWIGRRHWGQGLATEAVGALVDHAFRAYPAERVGAGVFFDNAASRRVLEKLGFSAAGRKPSASRARGGEVETVDMQLTRAGWAEISGRQ